MLVVRPIFAQTVLCSLSFALMMSSRGARDLRAVLCKDGTHATLEHTAVYMGKDCGRWTCHRELTSYPGSAATPQKIHLKDFDLCTANCETYCDSPVIDGPPDVEDCRALASYYKDAGRFTIDAHKYIIWEYDTCRVTQYNRLNHDDQRISYCFDQDHWAGVVDGISSHCGSKANAHGGSCYFYDSLYFSSITVEKA
ncbi:hypothetical protein HYPSUDRAFT_69928 [Hypholoma sublateritium FD-334 SS-4]|uniref:Uncharacterized protein n=1 Tax=Hypholoma sublateritium (strain FD-334 SS-4) TaxID=945553 RepID=A0A0D2NNQ1_HYPSF|nr:hypothetical protein HYPSUDRAFT_69928 [Hypholoma sublateritium FD-334 SS-4]